MLCGLNIFCLDVEAFIFGIWFVDQISRQEFAQRRYQKFKIAESVCEKLCGYSDAEEGKGIIVIGGAMHAATYSFCRARSLDINSFVSSSLY